MSKSLSPEYRSYLESGEWAAVRRIARQVLGTRCVICNEPAQDTHHRSYENFKGETLHDVAPFCRRCHSIADLIRSGQLPKLIDQLDEARAYIDQLEQRLGQEEWLSEHSWDVVPTELEWEESPEDTQIGLDIWEKSADEMPS